MHYECRSRCLIAAQPVDIYPADSREMVVVKPFAGILTCDIEEVLDFAEGAVVDKDIFHKSPAVGVGLHVDAAFAVSRIVAILNYYVAHTA